MPLAIAFAQYIVSLPATNENAAADLFGAATTEVQEDIFYRPDQIENLPAYHRASNLMHPDLHFSFPSITEKPGQKNLSANYIEEAGPFETEKNKIGLKRRVGGCECVHVCLCMSICMYMCLSTCICLYLAVRRSPQLRTHFLNEFSM